MKFAAILLAILLCNVNVCAQKAPRPEAYNNKVYIDNILIGNNDYWDSANIPTSLLINYYSFVDFKNKSIAKKKVKDIFIRKADLLDNNSELHFFTRKAKSGYLFINQTVNDWLSEFEQTSNKLDIAYTINGDKVISKRQIRKLIRLQENKLSSVTINIVEQSIVVEILIP